MPYSQDPMDEVHRRLLYSGSELLDYNRGKLNPRFPAKKGLKLILTTLGTWLACLLVGGIVGLALVYAAVGP